MKNISTTTTNILSHIGSLASLIGLLFTIKNPNSSFNGWQWLLLFLAITFFVVFIGVIIWEYITKKPLIFKNAKGIRDYMYKWIENGGRTVIFTRDLSWVSDDAMKDMLNNKARRGELTICMPNKISKVEEFEKSGATIVVYSSLNYTPLSRFTITNYGRDDAKVAVGKSMSSGNHLIEVYGNGEHPYFQVANDLINIINSI
jgi:hypothetical protein